MARKAEVALTALLAAAVSCQSEPTATTLPAAPASLAIVVQPTSAQAGAAISPAFSVSVLDSAGSVIPSSDLPIRIRLVAGAGTAGSHLRGITGLRADSGLATFSTINVDSVGVGYRLIASASGLPEDTSASFDVTPAPPARLVFVTQPMGVIFGRVMTPATRVAVLDSLGNLVAGATTQVTIALSSNPPSASFQGTLTRTLVGGIATFADLVIGASGDPFALKASAPGLSPVVSMPFTIYLPVKAISSRIGVSCLLTTAGTAYCWGARYQFPPVLSIPARAPGGLSFTAIDASDGTICALTGAGAPYCWTLSGSPTAVPSAPALTSITVGLTHACGLTAGGSAYCWGGNRFGQLGNGTRTDSSTPQLVSGGLSFGALSTGDYYTCGLTTTGAAYCWGANHYGQLGNGSTSDTTLPVAVSGGLTLDSISAGATSTCARTAAGGSYCWGTSVGLFASAFSTGYDSSSTPVATALGLNLASLSSRGEHACGLTSMGQAWCWGDLQFGELGNGPPATAQTFSLAPVPVAGNLVFSSIVAADQHTCGVTTSGDAYCWGSNYGGVLGDGTTTARNVPVHVKIY